MTGRVRTMLLLACLLSVAVPVVPAWGVRGDVTEFDLPEGSYMRALVAGPEGNLWLAGHHLCTLPPCGNIALIRLTPDGEVTTFVSPPRSGDTPHAITVGPDGNLWVTEVEFARVLRVTPEGKFTVFQIHAQTVRFIAAGPDGNLWVTGHHPGRGPAAIYRVTVDGQTTEFPLPETLSPGQIIAGPDGRMWFSASGQRIGMISMDGTIELLDVAFQPGGIVLGPDGNLWVDAVSANRSLIVRLSPDGEMTEFPIPFSVNLMVAGPEGKLWGHSYREGVSRIVAITTEGELDEEFALPQRPYGWPVGLAAGPDDDIWYLTLSSAVGRVELSSAMR